MKMSSSQSTKTKTNITLPQVRIPSGSRNPAGWSSTLRGIRGRGFPGAARLQQQEPAGDPPQDWPGTRPEWAVQWGLERNGLADGEDFTYQARLPGVGTSYYSTIDFLVPDFNIGIEVQGKFWHMGQGSDKILSDIFRVNAYAGQGIKIIFIDEPDALADPIYYVREALEGNDHSHVTTGKAN
jgi:hypothetical protein